jgi:hypothetical protein
LSPVAVVLSVAQVRLLLQAVLLLPLRDIAVTLELVRYQQQRKGRLRHLGLLHPP